MTAGREEHFSRGRSLLRRFAVDWWWAEFVAVVISVVVASVAVKPATGIDLLGRIPLEARRTAYTDLITITAFLAGFSSLAFTAYISWSSDGIRRLKSGTGSRLLRLWMAQISVPWGCALAIWFAEVLDRGDVLPTNPARWVALGAGLLLIASLVRSGYLFIQLAGIETQDASPVLRTAADPVSRGPRGQSSAGGSGTAGRP